MVLLFHFHYRVRKACFLSTRWNVFQLPQHPRTSKCNRSFWKLRSFSEILNDLLQDGAKHSPLFLSPFHENDNSEPSTQIYDQEWFLAFSKLFLIFDQKSKRIPPELFFDELSESLIGFENVCQNNFHFVWEWRKKLVSCEKCYFVMIFWVT